MSDLTDDRIDDPVDEPTEMPVPSTGARVWRRIIRRPMNWLNSPWPAERIAQFRSMTKPFGRSPRFSASSKPICTAHSS